jgi:hypothetical protein
MLTFPKLRYLDKVVSNFPQFSKPVFADTHATKFPSLDEEGRYTKPDTTASKPGMSKAPAPWDWQHAGTIIELKYETDVFHADGQINKSQSSWDALVQLAKS